MSTSSERLESGGTDVPTTVEDNPPVDDELPSFMLIDTDAILNFPPLPPLPPPVPDPDRVPRPRHTPNQRPQTGPHRKFTGKGNKTTKAAIKIAALNIRGHGNVNLSHKDNKWFRLNEMIRDEKIGMLVVGEAHLDDT
jgi:hypothetical protein